MIQEQRKWVAEEKAEEERQKQLAAEIVAKQVEMRNIIGVALYSFARMGPRWRLEATIRRTSPHKTGKRK